MIRLCIKPCFQHSESIDCPWSFWETCGSSLIFPNVNGSICATDTSTRVLLWSWWAMEKFFQSPAAGVLGLHCFSWSTWAAALPLHRRGPTHLCSLVSAEFATFAPLPTGERLVLSFPIKVERKKIIFHFTAENKVIKWLTWGPVGNPWQTEEVDPSLWQGIYSALITRVRFPLALSISMSKIQFYLHYLHFADEKTEVKCRGVITRPVY